MSLVNALASLGQLQHVAVDRNGRHRQRDVPLPRAISEHAVIPPLPVLLPLLLPRLPLGRRHPGLRLDQHRVVHRLPDIGIAARADRIPLALVLEIVGIHPATKNHLGGDVLADGYADTAGDGHVQDNRVEIHLGVVRLGGIQSVVLGFPSPDHVDHFERADGLPDLLVFPRVHPRIEHPRIHLGEDQLLLGLLTTDELELRVLLLAADLPLIHHLVE